MAERRQHKRVKKRVQVDYGEDELDQRGMANDISISGMFLDCRRPPDIGTLLHLRIHDPVRDFFVEAEVVRIRRVDQRLRTIKKEGVGLRFLNPADLIAAAFSKHERVQLTNTLVCEDLVAVKTLLQEQIYSRVIVVPIGELDPLAGETVEFTIRVDIGEGVNIDGAGRVVQLLGESGGDRKAVLMIDDADAVKNALESIR